MQHKMATKQCTTEVNVSLHIKLSTVFKTEIADHYTTKLVNPTYHCITLPMGVSKSKLCM